MLREQCRVGLSVTFGRECGEKTVGEVVKMNPKKAKVKTAVARGSTPAGTVWNVPYSMLAPVDWSDATPFIPQTKPFPLGLTISKVRSLTAAEVQVEGWDSKHAICMELSDGSVIYASQDYEGNGPGALFGRLKTGEHFTVG